MLATLKRARRRLGAYWKDVDGATAIEYGLIASAIAVTIIAAVFALGNTLGDFFNGIGSNITSTG